MAVKPAGGAASRAGTREFRSRPATLPMTFTTTGPTPATAGSRMAASDTAAAARAAPVTTTDLRFIADCSLAHARGCDRCGAWVAATDRGELLSQVRVAHAPSLRQQPEVYVAGGVVTPAPPRGIFRVRGRRPRPAAGDELVFPELAEPRLQPGGGAARRAPHRST